MANYLLSHYKNKYRILCDVEQDTNDFPRKLDGSYEDIDCYISCDKGVRVYSFGHGILECCVPTVGQARNLFKFIYRDFVNKDNTITEFKDVEMIRNDKPIISRKEVVSILDNKLYENEMRNTNIIFDIWETDKETFFKFRAKDFEALEPYIKPKTNCSHRSPFSSKNRPKLKYEIPNKDESMYKEIIKNVPKNQMILIGQHTKNYLQTLTNKNNSWDKMKKEILCSGLKNKQYIHSIGKWEEYLNYLKKELVCKN